MLLCNEIHMLMQYNGKDPFYASFSQAQTPSLGEGRGGYQVIRAITILSFPY